MVKLAHPAAGTVEQQRVSNSPNQPRAGQAVYQHLPRHGNDLRNESRERHPASRPEINPVEGTARDRFLQGPARRFQIADFRFGGLQISDLGFEIPNLKSAI
jgi:hypothetical protein